MSSLGKRIRDKRIEKDLTISELANRAKVSKSYISYIEREIFENPSVNVIKKIAEVLEIDVGILMEDKRQS